MCADGCAGCSAECAACAAGCFGCNGCDAGRTGESTLALADRADALSATLREAAAGGRALLPVAE
jgi:hypothetical protein